MVDVPQEPVHELPRGEASSSSSGRKREAETDIVDLQASAAGSSTDVVPMVVDREAEDISALLLALGIHRGPADVAESFCPGRLTKAPMFCAAPGTIYDLRGWDLSDHKQQTRCRLELEELEPCFILGSPVAASLNLSPADGVEH